MAQYRFQVISVVASYALKQVLITCSADLDEDTVNSDSVCLMTSSPRSVVDANVETDGSTIIISLKDYPQLDSDYMLILDDALRTITGNKIEALRPVHFTFKCEVLSRVKITYPTNFTAVRDELTVRFEETSKDKKDLTNFYQLEVASDNMFSKVLIKSDIDKTEQPEEDFHEILLPKFEEDGQYYIRICPVFNDKIGPWSETVSFVVDTKEPEPIIDEGEGNERPKLPVPEITDYTKEEAPKIEDNPPVQKLFSLEELDFDNETPEQFAIYCPAGCNFDDLVIKVERKAI